jgi:regulator of sigma E protease
MTWLLALSAFILFIGLVVVHELGHFIVARRNGVEAEEFGIGFPPKAWSKRIKSPKGDYDFSLNWLPLGGFVRLKGEHDADTEKGSFGAASLWVKVKIMLAGVVMNAVTAFALLTLLAIVGLPKVIENQFTVPSDTKIVKNEVVITALEADAPAAKAGLKEQDVVTAFTSKDGVRYEVGAAQKLPTGNYQTAGWAGSRY